MLKTRIQALLFAPLMLTPIIAVAQTPPRGEMFLGFSGRTGGAPMLRGWNVSGAVHIAEQLQIVADFSGHYGSRDVHSPQPGAITFSSLENFLLGNLSATPPTNSPMLRTGTDIHSLMAGPQFSQRINNRVRVFARALFGAARIHASAASPSGGPTYTFIVGLPQPPQQAASAAAQACHPVDASPSVRPYLALYPITGGISSTLSTIRICDTRTDFSFGAGGGLDVSVARHWAVRVFQGDYVNQPRVLGRGSNDFRLSSGLIWQW
ncbi:MAG: hypothetical protein HYX72_01715 [Acidobacteria bacterium]|nr:hypothetical protein [Acidobacteriota bacterium]